VVPPGREVRGGYALAALPDSLFLPVLPESLELELLSDLLSAFVSVFESEDAEELAGELELLSDDEPVRLSVMYQPEPLKTTPAGKSTLRTEPPHSGHSLTGGSANFWKRSKCFLHAKHSYSYVGMGLSNSLLWVA
jgi:hypothetical protein